MQKRILVGGIVVALLLAVGAPVWAAPHRQARSVITYPTDGATVSGVVQITGFATHPNILWYDVRFAPGATATGGSQWVQLAYVENTQVEGGMLATWDTTVIPDGLYTLVLTVRGQNDEMYYQTFTSNITVNNAAAAPPTPTPEPTPTEGAPPTSAPTIVVASPTPVTVEQPPTATPVASPTPGAEGEARAESSGEDGGLNLKVPVSFDRLQQAFVNGGKFTLFLFCLWGLYMFVKALARWGLRRFFGSPRR